MLQAREELEQEALFRWARLAEGRWPELRWLHHVPNGGLRSKAVAARLKAAGVKAGVPDLCLPVPRGGYHGLYIELKVGRNKPTEHQRAWLDHLTEAGYSTQVCYGWEAAKESIEGYLRGRG